MRKLRREVDDAVANAIATLRPEERPADRNAVDMLGLLVSNSKPVTFKQLQEALHISQNDVRDAVQRLDDLFLLKRRAPADESGRNVITLEPSALGERYWASRLRRR